MAKKHKPHKNKAINNSKEHEELKVIKDALIKAKKVLLEAKEAMEKHAEEQNIDVKSLKDLIIFNPKD